MGKRKKRLGKIARKERAIEKRIDRVESQVNKAIKKR